jgi:TRAP-type C4-dicarboxylate transport system permease small subunit
MKFGSSQIFDFLIKVTIILHRKEMRKMTNTIIALGLVVLGLVQLYFGWQASKAYKNTKNKSNGFMILGLSYGVYFGVILLIMGLLLIF